MYIFQMYSVTCVYSEFRRTKRSLPAPGSVRVTVLSPREPQLGTPRAALTGRRRLQWSRPELSRILEETEKRYGSESMEWFIEGQAFSRSYDLAPRSTPPPSRRQEDWERETNCWRERGEGGWLLAHTLPPLPPGRLRKRNKLLREEGEGGGREAESYDHEKVWSSIIIQNSLGIDVEHLMSLRITKAKLSLYFGLVHLFLLKV